jgi:hypothetical protein
MDFLWFAGDLLKWLTFGQYLHLGTKLWIGYLVALGCFLLVSLFFVRDIGGRGGNPRLFTVLALFAASWALAASAYNDPPYPQGAPGLQGATAPQGASGSDPFRLHDVAADMASFLMVFVGALLAREGNEPDRFLSSQRLQVYALVLLGVLTVPARKTHYGVHLEFVMAGALGLLGFVALGVGAKAIAHPKDYRWLFWILLAYGLFVVWRHAAFLIVLPDRQPMSDFLFFAFAVSKVLLTCIFCTVVVRYHDAKSPPSA